jgi:GT2 family glycosyltransferase
MKPDPGQKDMPDAPRLVALVVTHNRSAQLEQTLTRLFEAPASMLAAVLVFDNASDDDTPALLAARQGPRLHVVRSEVNLGGAGGFEAGMRAAVATFDPDWLVLMDDDARPEPGGLGAFHARARDGFDAWAAAVRYPDGSMCDMNRPWINPFGSAKGFLSTLIRGRNGFHMDQAAYDGQDIRPIDGGSFVGLFLSRAAMARGGYPDGGLFLYGDDVFYTLGLSQAGLRLAFDPALRFEHDCETLVPGALMRPLWKVYYFHRNQVMVYRRAAGPVLFWPVLALRATAWWRRARAYGPDAPRYRRLLRQALADGLRRRTTRSHPEVRALSAAPQGSGETAASAKSRTPSGPGPG